MAHPTVYILGSGTYDNYCTSLRTAGAVPLLSGTPDVAPDACHGLLLPGGGDILGKLPFNEQHIIHLFVAAKKPILGICRGMQALNVFFGGTLYTDIPGHQIPAGDMIHPSIAKGPIAALLGPHPIVNSNHHQAVKRLGDGLTACQWAGDRTIEAVYHPRLPILGVQWHPERQSFADRRPDAVDAAPLFYPRRNGPPS